MLVRTPDARLTFPNFARSLVAGAMTSLKIGMDILAKEHVQIDKLLGHGGYFKTPVAGQTILSAALKAPISVMETAGEGGRGAWRCWRRTASIDRQTKRWRTT